MNPLLVMFLSLWISASSFPPQSPDENSNTAGFIASNNDLPMLIQKLLDNSDGIVTPEKNRKRNSDSRQEDYIGNEFSDVLLTSAKDLESTAASDSTEDPTKPGTESTTMAPGFTTVSPPTVNPTKPGTESTTVAPGSTTVSPPTVNPTKPGTESTTVAPGSTTVSPPTVNPTKPGTESTTVMTTTKVPEPTTPKPNAASKVEFSLLLLFPFFYSIIRP